MNAADLERWGRTLHQIATDHPDGVGGDWFMEFGAALWTDWEEDIANDCHPQLSTLLAFARGWGVPGAPWLPALARYLADRLDPEVSTRARPGRPRKSAAERWTDWRRSRGIAVAVVRLAREGRTEEEAIADVARRLMLDDVDVRLTLYGLRDVAEKIADSPAGDVFLQELDAGDWRK
jgi:hypothetical protein